VRCGTSNKSVPVASDCQLENWTGAGGSITVRTFCGLKYFSLQVQSSTSSEPLLDPEFAGQAVHEVASTAPVVVLNVLGAQLVHALDFVGENEPAKQVWHVVADVAPIDGDADPAGQE
jgi:hypothetical protein